MAPDPLDVTVAPSDIRAFGSVLDDLTTLLADLRAQVLSAQPVDFGVYANSSGAAVRYYRAVDQRVSALDQLVKTADGFTDGTAKLARDYDDLSAMNAVLAQQITDALGDADSVGETR